MERTQPRIRARAEARIPCTVLKPNTESPALVEVRLRETFTGDIDGEPTVRALQVLRDDRSASSSACNDSVENWGDARG